MRVLNIEDDESTSLVVDLMLRSEGFTVYSTAFGEDGISLAMAHDYDIILLNVNLPDISGIDVLRTLRVARVNTPIIFLSGTSDIATKVKTFSGGADDFIPKPFHKDELIARIHAVVRRSRGHPQSVITTGNMVINLDARTVHVGKVGVPLTNVEYRMLELLSLRKGTVVSKEMFLNHLYTAQNEPGTKKIVDVFMCKVRSKIAARNNGIHHIETVWGRGYALIDPSAAL